MQIAVQLSQRVLDGEEVRTQRVTGMIQKIVETVGQGYIDITLSTELSFWKGHCRRLELYHPMIWTHSTDWWPVTHTHWSTGAIHSNEKIIV